MRIDISILRYAFLISLLIGFASASFPSLINCYQIFKPPPNPYAGALANLTDYSGMANIVLLIVILDFSILSVAYAFGTAFQITNLTTFAQTELLEGVFNVIIFAAIGFGILSVYPAIAFFINVAQLGSSGPVAVPSSSLGIYTQLCSYISSNIINSGFTNWLGLIVNLYIANTMQSANLLAIPNSFGYAYQPFAGIALLIQLLWDDQAAFFGTMFFGMFLVSLLFIIYYLFPIFLYAGIALRSFPWTRAAGGSLVALFIAFYIVFPALMFPFLASTHPGPGICSAGAANPLCNPGSFAGNSISGLMSGLSNFNFGVTYYLDIVDFVSGFFYVGLNMFGLVIALLISYEIVEKIGSILGAPSMNAQRALSRIL
jgi:hypothetical protein